MRKRTKKAASHGAHRKNTETSGTWRDIVHQALKDLKGEASLAAIYAAIERHPRTKNREHWKAKVRQQLETSAEFVRAAPGTWALTAKYTPEETSKFERLRRERYPRQATPEADE